LNQLVDSKKELVPLELLFLIKNGYNTGYALKKAYEEYFGITVSFGTIYPWLHSLYKGGYLAKAASNTGRTSKFYTLTREGQRALDLNASFLRTFSKVLDRPRDQHRSLFEKRLGIPIK